MDKEVLVDEMVEVVREVRERTMLVEGAVQNMDTRWHQCSLLWCAPELDISELLGGSLGYLEC